MPKERINSKMYFIATDQIYQRRQRADKGFSPAAGGFFPAESCADLHSKREKKADRCENRCMGKKPSDSGLFPMVF
jgi:hypothetical protein